MKLCDRYYCSYHHHYLSSSSENHYSIKNTYFLMIIMYLQAIKEEGGVAFVNTEPQFLLNALYLSANFQPTFRLHGTNVKTNLLTHNS